MSLNFPFSGFPGFRRHIAYKPPFIKYESSSIANSNYEPHHYKEDNFNSTNKSTDSVNKNFSNNNDCFEIFGIKLYYDDALLISLIFILFKEGVEDTELFIALILLLLS